MSLDMETFITPFTDLIKHFVQTNYIQFEDQKLNLLLYSCVSILISYIVKVFFNWKTFKENWNTFVWFIIYKVLRQKKFIFPISDYQGSRQYYYKNPNGKHCIELTSKNALVFLDILSLKLEKYNQGNDTNAVSFRHNFKLPEYVQTKHDFKITHKTLGFFYKFDYDMNEYSDFVGIAFLDGYFIMLNRKDFDAKNGSNITSFQIWCENRVVLDKFLNIIQVEIDTNLKSITKYQQKLQVVESLADGYPNFIGTVKTHLTFETYVSRHKTMIIRKLNAFQNGCLFKHSYIENNLGIMLHGDYGTGKTFLISAIANYLGRSVFTINFSKIKTKAALASAFSTENIEQYIYSFDEFDYLLTDLLETKSGDSSSEDTKMKIQVLSTQIANCSDKEVAKPLIEELKKLMDNENNEKLTYAHLLSELSGLTSTTNRIIIATTNFPNKIPKALLRPGRFDLLINLDKFNEEEIRELLTKIYKPDAEGYALIKEARFKNNKYTPAQIIMKSTEYPILEDMIKYLSVQVVNVD